jgi:hypothetical protein
VLGEFGFINAGPQREAANQFGSITVASVWSEENNVPRYYFDINDGVRDLRDDEGVTLNDKECARKEAIATLAQLANEILPDGNNHTFTANVRDETNEPIYEATLALKSGWVS